jgi:hypothetical protein
VDSIPAEETSLKRSITPFLDYAFAAQGVALDVHIAQNISHITSIQ